MYVYKEIKFRLLPIIGKENNCIWCNQMGIRYHNWIGNIIFTYKADGETEFLKFYSLRVCCISKKFLNEIGL